MAKQAATTMRDGHSAPNAPLLLQATKRLLHSNFRYNGRSITRIELTDGLDRILTQEERYRWELAKTNLIGQLFADERHGKLKAAGIRFEALTDGRVKIELI